MDEDQKKRRDEERLRREAARKAAEEEKAKKEEERRKRLAEEKEREVERERKKKEKEDKARIERKEREEKERKLKEERDAKLAADKAAAAVKREQQEKEERERRLVKEREDKEKAEKAERERVEREKEKAEKERERAAQRATQKNTRPPSSPRASAASSSRLQTAATPPKKILSKPSSSNLVSPIAPTPPRQQQQRPMIVTAQNGLPQPLHTAGPSTPGYSPGVNGIIPTPVMSPRMPYNPAGQFNGFGPGPSMQGPPILAPSVLPRTYGAGIAPLFDASYNSRPIRPPSAGGPGPIGPPSKLNHTQPQQPPMLAPGSTRRASVVDLGPITRPTIAPIARPTTDGGSGSASPVRRSPSPKGVLGSSALAADDDEVVSAAGGRRLATGSQLWGGVPSPRTTVDVRVPWGPPAPGYAGPPHAPRPPIGASPWTAQHPDWPGHPANFFPSPFVTHNPSPPPHSGS